MNDTTAALSIADLIRRYQDATGASLQQIADASGLSKSKIGQLAQGDGHAPRAETITKLARGLRLPLNVVQEAALVTAGIHPGGERAADHRVSAIAARIAQLDDDDLATVEGLVFALMNRRGRRDG